MVGDVVQPAVPGLETAIRNSVIGVFFANNKFLLCNSLCGQEAIIKHTSVNTHTCSSNVVLYGFT